MPVGMGWIRNNIVLNRVFAEGMQRLKWNCCPGGFGKHLTWLNQPSNSCRRTCCSWYFSGQLHEQWLHTIIEHSAWLKWLDLWTGYTVQTCMKAWVCSHTAATAENQPRKLQDTCNLKWSAAKNFKRILHWAEGYSIGIQKIKQHPFAFKMDQRWCTNWPIIAMQSIFQNPAMHSS